MAPFYGWCSTLSRLEPLRGGSLLFTTSLTFADNFLFHHAQNVSLNHVKQCNFIMSEVPPS